MSLRRFSGWTPTTEVTHEYDDQGRLVGSKQWTESEWSDLEQGWMLALREIEASCCPGCGGDREETFAPENQFRYKVKPPHRCHRCTAISQAVESYAKNDGEHMQALRWVATLID